MSIWRTSFRQTLTIHFSFRTTNNDVAYVMVMYSLLQFPLLLEAEDGYRQLWANLTSGACAGRSTVIFILSKPLCTVRDSEADLTWRYVPGFHYWTLNMSVIVKVSIISLLHCRNS